jgi:hypothetical protein
VVGGSIGVLSFVAFFGAAILWLRMDRAHIPANEAVAVVPKSVLITTGATFLVPSLLAALGFTAVLYLIEVGREHSEKRRSGLQELEDKLTLQLREVEAQQKAALTTATDAVERAKKIESLADRAGEVDSVGQGTVDKIEETAQEEFESVDRLAKKAVPGEDVKTRLVEAKRDVNEERAAIRDRVEESQLRRRTVSIAVAFGLGAVLAFWMLSIHLRLGRVGVLAFLVVVLTSTCLAVLNKNGFAWFALATFVAVGTLCGFLTYYRTVDEPQVEPAAVLRTHGPPIFGFFVAQSSDRVYLGTTVRTGAVRLDAIPREEVTDMTIAALQPVETANRLGRELAFQICHLARERGRAAELAARRAGHDPPKLADEAPCTLSDIRLLRPAGSA